MCLAVLDGDGASLRLPKDCELQTIPDMGCSVVWMAEHKPSIFTAQRASAARSLLRFQKALEDIAPGTRMLAGTLSGIVYGHDRSEAIASFRASADEVRQALGEFGCERQFQISVGWDVAEAIAHVRSLDSSGAAAVTSEDALVAEIDRLIARARASVDVLFDEHIKPEIVGQSLLPYDGHGDALRRVVHLDASGEDRLFTALEAFDNALFLEARIQLAGPLPAISFAHVDLLSIDQDRSLKARKRLALGESFTVDDVSRAFKAAAFSAHSDTATGETANSSGSDLNQLKADRNLLQALVAGTADGEAPPRFLWQVDGEGGYPL